MEIAKNQIDTTAKRRLSVSLYLNYLVHGMGLIILAQNMNSLGTAWNQPIKIVSFVISGIGIGRLISYLITGFLSDKISRKFFVELGMFCYAVFALGMPMTKNIWIAYFFAILAGVANSSLDAGTYTTFVEMNGGNGAYTILIKAFVSVGEFILPILVTILAGQGMWFGWSFMAMVILLAINFCLILPLKFPVANQADGSAVNERESEIKGVAKKVMTGALVVYGYSSMALMIWFTQWITMFAQQTMHMSDGAAHFLLSLYSIGSITGVLVLFALLGRNVKESHPAADRKRNCLSSPVGDHAKWSAAFDADCLVRIWLQRGQRNHANRPDDLHEALPDAPRHDYWRFLLLRQHCFVYGTNHYRDAFRHQYGRSYGC